MIVDVIAGRKESYWVELRLRTKDGNWRWILSQAVAAEAMFGCPAAEALGNMIDRFIPERFRGSHAGHIDRFGDTGTTTRAMGQQGKVYGLRNNGGNFPSKRPSLKSRWLAKSSIP